MRANTALKTSTSTAQSTKAAAQSIPDVCDYVGGVSKQTMYRLAAAGQVRLIKIGRRTVVPTADLDALLAEGTS